MEIGKKVRESEVMSKGKLHWSWYRVVDRGRGWICNILGYDRHCEHCLIIYQYAQVFNGTFDDLNR